MEHERDDAQELRGDGQMLEEEIAVLRRRLQDAPRRVRVLEERLLEPKNKLSQAACPEPEAGRRSRGDPGAARAASRRGREADRHLPIRSARCSGSTRTAPPTSSPRAASCGSMSSRPSRSRRSRSARKSCSTRPTTSSTSVTSMSPARSSRSRKSSTTTGSIVLGQGRRGAGRRVGRAPARDVHPGRRSRADRPAHRPCLREAGPARGRGAGARRGARHHLRRDRRSRRPDRDRSRTPSSCRTSTRSASPTTTWHHRRASCSTAHPAAARR